MSESIDMLREEIAALREKLAAAEKDRDAALDSLRAHDAGRRTGLVHRELYAQVMRQRDEAREKLDAALEAARPMEVAVEASVGRPDDLVIHVTLVTLRAVVSALAPAPSAPPRDREDRCRRCGWPLAKSIREGCVPGNCSYRPEEGSEEWKRMRDRDTARAALDSYLAGKTDSHGRCATCGDSGSVHFMRYETVLDENGDPGGEAVADAAPCPDCRKETARG